MSIRGRLLAATAVIAVVALVGADAATYTSLRSYLYGQIDNALELSHRPVEASVTQSGPASSSSAPSSAPSTPTAASPSTPTPAGTESEPGALSECPKFHGRPVDAAGLSPGTFIEVRSNAGRAVWHCALPQLETAHLGLPVLPAHITGFTAGPGDDGEPTVYFTAGSRTGSTGYRVRASILHAGPDGGGQLIVAQPLTSTSHTLADLRNLEIGATAAAILLALLLGWWLVRASLHPLRDIERTADAISAGALSERVPGDDARTEVGHVARAFNVMLERIESAFAVRDRTEAELRDSEERMRRFVADASHELRTPLAAVRAYADLFDRGAAERPDDLRRAMRGIQGESTRMSQLVEDLLLLAHLDEGRPLHLEQVDLVALAADAASTARAVGPEWPVVLSASQKVVVSGDELRLRQVLDNLLANVRSHTPPGTTATVRIVKDGPDAVVSVSDDGPGLSKEQRARIFERFFRADPSRSRAHGGAGLGLSIVDALVRAHGGHVTVTASASGGAEFTVHLPAAGGGEAGHGPLQPPRRNS
jgi:two-component system OmpR family sensor kinase